MNSTTMSKMTWRSGTRFPSRSSTCCWISGRRKCISSVLPLQLRRIAKSAHGRGLGIVMQKIAHAIFATPSRVWASVFRNLKVKQRRGSCEKMLMHRIHAARVLFSLPLSSIDVVCHFRFFVVNEVLGKTPPEGK